MSLQGNHEPYDIQKKTTKLSVFKAKAVIILLSFDQKKESICVVGPVTDVDLIIPRALDVL